MEPTLMQQGVNLMLFGMGTVFVFLTLLVFATSAMSGVIVKHFPEPEPEPVKKPKRPATATAAAVDARTLAVLQAAIDKHRQR